MTPSPNAMDDVELSEILSSTSSPGLPQNSEDFTIDLGKYCRRAMMYRCSEVKFTVKVHKDFGNRIIPYAVGKCHRANLVFPFSGCVL